MKEGQEILLVESSEQDAQQVEQAFRRAQIFNPIARAVDLRAAQAHLLQTINGTQGVPVFVLVGSGDTQEIREFLIWVREHPTLKKLAVVLLQSRGPLGLERDAFAPGATAVFPKRLDFKNLGALVKAAGGFWMLHTSGESRARRPGAFETN